MSLNIDTLSTPNMGYKAAFLRNITQLHFFKFDK